MKNFLAQNRVFSSINPEFEHYDSEGQYGQLALLKSTELLFNDTDRSVSIDHPQYDECHIFKE